MRYQHVGEGILAALVVFIFLAAIEPVIGFNIFQARDIARGAELAAGNPIFFGPETTGGGHLPGGFYYAILAIPALLGLGWGGHWFWLVALCAVAAGISWAFHRKHLGRTAALISVLPFLCFPCFTEALREFWNPSYLPVFVILILFCLYHIFSDYWPATSSKRVAAWLVACGLTALSMQIHFTAVAFIAAFVTLQLLAGRWGLRRLPTKIFLGGLALLAALLLPYFIWLLGQRYSFELGQSVAPNTGLETWSLPTVLQNIFYFLKQLPQVFTSGMPTHTVLRWEILIPFALWLSCRRTQDAPKKPLTFLEQAEKIASVCSFWSIWFAFSTIFVAPNSRYAILFLICFFSQLSFSFALQKSAGLEFWRKRGAHVVTAAALLALGVSLWRREFIYYREIFPWGFLALALLAVFMFATREKITVKKAQWILAIGLFSCLSISHIFAPEVVTRSSVEGICRYVREQTPWTYPEARSRTFFIGLWWPFWSVESICANLKPSSAVGKNPAAAMDGLFVVQINQPKLSPHGEFWTGAVNDSLERAIRSGAVVLDPPVIFDSVFIVPYRTVDTREVPKHFHNSGGSYEPYNLHSYSTEIQELSPEPYPYRFLFNNSLRKAGINDIALLARILEDRTLEVKIIGRPLSEPLLFAAPAWRESLSRPYIEVECKDRRAKLIIAETVGATGHDHKDFLAPFERRFPWPCKGAAKSLTLGYEASMYGKADSQVTLPGQNVEMALGSASQRGAALGFIDEQKTVRR